MSNSNTASDMSSYLAPEKRIFEYPKYWAECFGAAPFLPTTREEMDQLGWDSCDVIVVTGDAYVDHPSFGMAIIGRLLESQGFRVGIIAQPDWSSAEAFKALGKPNLYFGVAAGNMDSMINRYTADRRLRHDDAYTPGNVGGKRPDRATLHYTQRCKEAFKGVPVIIGGIEASLRRIAHYDYWSEKVRRSMLLDSKADMLIYGNAERPLVEVTHRIANGETLEQMQDIRGTAIMVKQPLAGWRGKDSTTLDAPGMIDAIINPYIDTTKMSNCEASNGTNPEPVAAKDAVQTLSIKPMAAYEPVKGQPWFKTYAKLPSYDVVKSDPIMYAHASRVMHHETNPGSARALYQEHGNKALWVNPPAILGEL